MEIRATKYEFAAMAVACYRSECEICVLKSACSGPLDSYGAAANIGIARHVTVVPDEGEVET